MADGEGLVTAMPAKPRLDRTRAALAAFDAHGEILDTDAVLGWTDADLAAHQAEHERLGRAVAEAFADETADRNDRATALLMDPSRAPARGSFIHRLVGEGA